MFLTGILLLFHYIHGQQIPYSNEGQPASQVRSLSGRFLHITDFHPDWFYRPGSKLNEFCHVGPHGHSEEDLATIDVLRSRKDHKDATAGYWAPPPNTECDTSIPLVNATFDFVRRRIIEEQGGVDFVIWTGDSVRHDNDNRYPRTLKQIYASNMFMVNKMQELFGSNKYSEDFIPVVPTVGNNDVYPHNIMFAGPKSKTIAEYKAMWKAWIPPEQSHTFDRGAYFHMSVATKLSVVSLNSLYFYENNKAVDGCSSKDEPGSLQLEWLEIQLKLFRQQGIRVWIIGHVPPTDRQWYDDCYYQYANLMIEYRDLIIGQIFGHVNIDHFYFMQYDDTTKNAAPKTRIQARADIEPLSLERTKSSDDIHILKSPLDVLEDARNTFDKLPIYPHRASQNTDADVDELLGKLAVVTVSPSVVPNYYPTFRVYEYRLEDPSSNLDLSLSTNTKKKKKKKNRKKKKKKRPSLPPVDNLGPGYIQQKYTPMRYTQWFLNTTTANANHSSKEPLVNYEIEYDTSAKPYSMPDLTVGSWVTLGNSISGLHGSGKVSKKDLLDDPILCRMSGLEEADIEDSAHMSGPDFDRNHDSEPLTILTDAKHGKSKKKRKKHQRHNGFWKVFLYRGFVSTGLEHDYQVDS